MKNAIRMAMKISAFTSVGLGGWYAGKKYERLQYSKIGGSSQGCLAPNLGIHSLPALPIFGTVSAASPIVPGDQSVDMGSKLSTTASRVSEIMRFGFPGFDNIKSFEDFVLSYDRRNRVAHWVFEHLTKERLHPAEKVNRSGCEFKPDESIHPFFRSTNSDYKGSGYDRGHLAAAGNHKMSQTHIEQTFYLSNMAPQVGVGFNRNSWNRLENYVRDLTKIYRNVYVCTGPLYLPMKEADGKKYVRYEVIGANHVAVPTHFYKVVVGEAEDSRLEMEAFVMPNKKIDDNTPLSSFQVPPESIERAAGLLFFDKISREKLTKVNGKKIGR